ncbi:MAG: ATP-binding protein, partial [Nitrososphaerota archaeon]
MLSKWSESKVNISKLIEDLRQQFPYDPLTALIVETVANAIDSGATEINIVINSSGRRYTIRDNGMGMNKEDFENYHNIAYTTKGRGRTIGFAGVGAKIFLDRAVQILTETKSINFHAASEWMFEGEALKWRYIEPLGKVRDQGTYVDVVLAFKEDADKLNKDFILKVIRENYNAILLGEYGKRSIIVNGEELRAWIPQTLNKKELKIKVDAHHVVKCTFMFCKESIREEEFRGIGVVVNGKMVTREWFDQHPMNADKITGYIIADHLSSIITTSKDNFDRKSSSWKKFKSRVAWHFARWLSDIGVMP